MKSICFFVLCISLSSCSSESTSNLIGTWGIDGVIQSDDANGVFEPTTSNKKITLEDLGPYTTNGDICTFSLGSDIEKSGSWSFTDNVLLFENCPTTIPYILEEDVLILTFDCVETCQHRYRKE